MSIASDLLTASAPTRLVCRRGSWILEIERLVAIERDVYQPRTQRVEGDEAILQHLQRAPGGGALANAASSLIRGPASARECSFEAVDSEWVACEGRARADSARPGAASAASAVSATEAELRAELCLLRATHAGLRERVARLEAMLSSHSDPRELLRAQRVSLAANVSERPQPAAPLPRAAARAPAVAAQAVRARSAEPAPPSSAEPAPPSSVEAAPPATASRLKLPTASAVGGCLNTLIGRKIAAKELRPVPFPGKGKSPCWLCRLVDDDGVEVGVIVADLLAVVGLGGALMMVPAAELTAQRAAEMPSEDVLSAMAEVANNLSATINQQPETLHVRVKALEAMAAGSLDWVKKAPLALALELASGMGQLFLFAR